jgi:hypothetical protein
VATEESVVEKERCARMTRLEIAALLPLCIVSSVAMADDQKPPDARAQDVNAPARAAPAAAQDRPTAAGVPATYAEAYRRLTDIIAKSMRSNPYF